MNTICHFENMIMDTTIGTALELIDVYRKYVMLLEQEIEWLREQPQEPAEEGRSAFGTGRGNNGHLEDRREQPEGQPQPAGERGARADRPCAGVQPAGVDCGQIRELMGELMLKPKLYYEFTIEKRTIRLRGGMNRLILETRNFQFARGLLAAMKDSGLFVNGTSLLNYKTGCR